MTGRLAGKVAVITGAGSGIGEAMARLFCAEGACVVAADISGCQDTVAAEIGEACVPVRADVANSADVQAMLRLAITRFGRLDILCNNAGIAGAMAPLGEYTEEEFDLVWSINGRGVFLGMRYAIPLMLANGGGTIVNTASTGSQVAFPTLSAYCASKGAVMMLTKTAAVEYAGQGIRINAICPGVIRTGISNALPVEYIEAVEKLTPMGRIGEPAEIARLAMFLASDESSFMTGASVMVDGGFTAI